MTTDRPKLTSTLSIWTEQEREVMHLLYHEHGRSQEEVAVMVGLSQQRVAQVAAAALAKLQSLLKEKGADGVILEVG